MGTSAHQRMVQKRVLTGFLLTSIIGALHSFLVGDGRGTDIFVLAVFVLARFAFFWRDFTLAHMGDSILPDLPHGAGPIRRGALWTAVTARRGMLFATQVGWVAFGFSLAHEPVLAVTAAVMAMELVHIGLLNSMHRLGGELDAAVSGPFRNYLNQKVLLMACLAAIAVLGSSATRNPVWVEQHIGVAVGEVRSVALGTMGASVLIGLALLLLGHRSFHLGFDGTQTITDAVKSANDAMACSLSGSATVAALVGPTLVYARGFSLSYDQLLPACLLIAFWLFRLVFYQRDYALAHYGEQLMGLPRPNDVAIRRIVQQSLHSMVAATWIMMSLLLAQSKSLAVAAAVILLVDTFAVFFCGNYLAQKAEEGHDNVMRGHLRRLIGVYGCFNLSMLVVAFLVYVGWRGPSQLAERLPWEWLRGEWRLAVLPVVMVGAISLLSHTNKRILSNLTGDIVAE